MSSALENMVAGAMPFETALQEWIASEPALDIPPAAAAEAVSRFLLAGEGLLALLPDKQDRDLLQQEASAQIHDACRAARMRFIEAHADWTYSTLGGIESRGRLSELAFRAAVLIPGLVPTREQIARERSHSQIQKEGREIDQGIFFRGLLRSPKTGPALIEAMLRPTQRALDLLPQFRRDGRLTVGTVSIEQRGPAAHVTMHNTRALNAEDDGSIDDLETAVDLVLLANDVRVGALRGGFMSHPRYVGRRVFSAGINLDHLNRGQISFVDFLLRRELGTLNKILRGLRLDEVAPGHGVRTVEKPWIAAVDSFAIGGGAQLLLVFDRVIAAADSYFSLPAAREGIVPGVANLRLSRVTGARMARQIILAGRQVRASEADAALLFDEVVDSAEMDAAIDANVARLDSPAVVANRKMLTMAEEPIDLFRSYMAEFALVQAERLYAPDVMNKVWRA